MDETVDIEQEMFYYSTETMPSLLARIQKEYASVPRKIKDRLQNKIAGGMRAYEIERDNPRPEVRRGQVWRVEEPVGIGHVTNGYRWVVVISNAKHARYGSVANVINLVSEKVVNEISQMEITNDDLEDGELEKIPSRINLTDIYTMDRQCFNTYKGKVSQEFMKKLMKRVAFQLGMTHSY